jgi:methionine sulfoxide reductase heme-binding subunit
MLIRFIKIHLPVVLLGLIPFFRLVYFALDGGSGLGANPVESITRSTGTWALTFLCITLAVSPMRKVLGLSGLQKHRRTLGLLMFFYALCHFLIWFWLDQNLVISDMFTDVYKRPFITAGFIAFVLTIPLALTSNQWSIRRLKKHWSKLHKLVYLIALLVILHFFWHKAGKNDFLIVGIYAVMIGLLLGYRIFETTKKQGFFLLKIFRQAE